MQIKGVLNRILAFMLALMLCVSGALVNVPAVARASDVSDFVTLLADASDALWGENVYRLCHTLAAIASVRNISYSLWSDFRACSDAAESAVGTDDYAEYWTEFQSVWADTYGHSDSELEDCLNALYRYYTDILDMTKTKSIFSAMLKSLNFTCADLTALMGYIECNPLKLFEIVPALLESTVNGTTTLADEYFSGDEISSDSLNDSSFDSSDEIVVSSDAMEALKDICDDYIEEYCGYYLCESTKYDEVKVSIFNSTTAYDNFITFYDWYFDELTDLTACVSLIGSDSANFSGPFIYNSNNMYAGYYINDTSVGRVFSCDSTWSYCGHKYFGVSSSKSGNYSSYSSLPVGTTSYDTYDYRGAGVGYLYYNGSSPFLIDDYGVTWSFISRYGDPVKVFKSLQQFKDYACGSQSVYVSTSYTTYSPSSVTYSGNYVNNSNVENDYSTIQETIDNSSETTTIDESTVNNIVNNYYTENIYNYEDDTSKDDSGSSSDDSDDSDDSGSSWLDTLTGGLSSLLSGLASLLGVVFDFIGDLISTVSDLLNTLIDSITSLSGNFGAFGDFLAATFAFIPDEVWAAIALGFEVAVVLMVVKLIKG